MPTLDEVKRDIENKSLAIQALQSEVSELLVSLNKLEEEEQDEHLKDPQPGDFWHDGLSPVLIVLEVCDEGVYICDKTAETYEPLDQEMVLVGYQDPEVKRHFSRSRKSNGYTFVLEASRKVSMEEFRGILKCCGDDQLKDETTCRCIPGRASGFVSFWVEMKSVDASAAFV